MPLTFPVGQIQAPAEHGSSFNRAWWDIARWAEQISAAAVEFGAEPERIAGHVAIESRGNPQADNGQSAGLLQVRFDLHYRMVGELAGRTMGPAEARAAMKRDPLLALRAGARLLAWLRQQCGSWDGASSSFAAFGCDWTGPPHSNGTTPAGYRRSLDALMRELAEAQPGPGPGPDAVDWSPLPYPPMVELIASKPYEGAGFTRVAPRRPQTVGCCNHITEGEGSIEWYAHFFSTGGERATDALVDTVIGRDGRIGLVNDWRDPNKGGTRAGWANGGTDGTEGDGVAWVRKYGASVNTRLVSKEHVTRQGVPLNDAQMDASIRLSAAVAQECRVPWQTYPYKDGVSVELKHRDFATKPCPAEPFVSVHYPVLVREVKALLRRKQGGDEQPTPDPTPRFPGLAIPEPVFLALWPEGVEPNPAGAFTKYMIASGQYAQVHWYRHTGEESWLSTAAGLWRFADGKVTEVGD